MAPGESRIAVGQLADRGSAGEGCAYRVRETVMGDVETLVVAEFASAPALWAGVEVSNVRAVGFNGRGRPGHRIVIVDAFCQRCCCEIGLRSLAPRVLVALSSALKRRNSKHFSLARLLLPSVSVTL
jgi:hypothetical protein